MFLIKIGNFELLLLLDYSLDLTDIFVNEIVLKSIFEKNYDRFLILQLSRRL